MLKSLQAWLGLADTTQAAEPAPLRELVNALDRLEPARAQYLARFAYLLGRVARADEHVSDEETRTMEALLVDHGALSPDQAILVVSLAKASSLLFGVTADFAVTQEFADSTTYDQKLALARCLFAVAASDERISIAEEAELHRITNQLRVEGPDLRAIRLQHRRFLPGLRRAPSVDVGVSACPHTREIAYSAAEGKVLWEFAPATPETFADNRAETALL